MVTVRIGVGLLVWVRFRRRLLGAGVLPKKWDSHLFLIGYYEVSLRCHMR